MREPSVEVCERGRVVGCVPEEIGIPLEEQGPVKVMADGRRYVVTKGGKGPWVKIGDAEGAIEGLAWNERAKRAEKGMVLLLAERERIRDRILERCIELRGRKYESEGGALELNSAFLDIEKFARGAPYDKGALLEEMRRDGVRWVEAVRDSEVVLTCGHRMKGSEQVGLKLQEVVECGKCVEMLKARGWYEKRKKEEKA